MVRLRVNGRLKLIPEAWSETSTDLYQRIIAGWEPDKPIAQRDRLKLFSIMVDEPYKAIAASEDATLEGLLYACTCYVYEEELKLDGPVPRALFIGERAVQLPRDVGRLSIGQNLHVRQVLAEVKEERLAVSKVVAIYIQRHYDAVLKDDKIILADFDFDRAMEIEPLVAQAPITVTGPIAFFFLRRLRSYGNGWLIRFVLKIRMSLGNVRL